MSKTIRISDMLWRSPEEKTEEQHLVGFPVVTCNFELADGSVPADTVLEVVEGELTYTPAFSTKGYSLMDEAAWNETRAIWLKTCEERLREQSLLYSLGHLYTPPATW